MKKILSLILVACMAFSCLALSACVWEGMFGTTTSTVPTASTTQPTTKPTTSTTTTTATTTTTTTTIPDDGGEPEDLVIRHGDNFTEDDIEFVKSFHKYQLMLDTIKITTFSEKVDNVKNGRYHLYYAKVDIENPYYICGYIDLSIPENDYEFGVGYIDVTKYVWYKYYDKESIPKQIDNLAFGWSFHIYDAVITKDIGTGSDHEYKFKYYRIAKSPFKDILEIYEYIIIYDRLPINEIIGIGEILKGSMIYQGYTTTEGKDYLQLKYCDVMYYDDGRIATGDEYNREYIGEYFDILYPYFEHIEELDEETTNPFGEKVKYSYLGICVDTITEILFEN